ncbi:hypothetical protein WS70_27300 [Burkholderia mayonis]|uniref:Uncharacterized protein n=1 Tax=Burkholderia mayonis TaxID=1385591 RepID=A0A1B4FP13_9BURK|nr:hypothetical protein WS70_27300 [Burkholderia mayonis]KVE47889.1 hypothetical protein WS70_25460 [Burkholderia mayonis]
MDRILRFGSAPDSAGHAHAVARVGASGPVGNVLRSLRRCRVGCTGRSLVCSFESPEAFDRRDAAGAVA